MGYPIRIIIKYRSTKILFLKSIVSVNNRFNMILVFHNMEPSKNVCLEIIHILVNRLMFHIKHGRKIPRSQVNLIQKIISLHARTTLITPEMIGSTDESILTSVIKILSEIFIHTTASLCTFYKDKAQRCPFYHSIAQFIPVNISLIMRNINSPYLIPFRIASITV